ncbi:3'-5' exonuclease [Marinomonas sp. THO17]|uniref:3'-5' exonuclease n=1 Tax=Marinomonas sp. THO17 TaxID=3149048 RepID=UPI00336BD119
MWCRILEVFKHWRQQRYSIRRTWSDWEYLVLDIETSGLDPKQDHIVSIGWVCIKQGAIDLDSARHLILEEAQAGENVGIHMITDSDIQQYGKKQESALRYLRHFLRGRVLVMHHAPLEIGFLKAAWKQHVLPNFGLIWLDTLMLEKAKAERAQQPIQEGGFRLNQCRERYHLPDYQGHDALTDALATAELLLAQIAYQGKGCRLYDLSVMAGGKSRLAPR